MIVDTKKIPLAIFYLATNNMKKSSNIYAIS